MQHISNGLGNLSTSNETACDHSDSCGQIRRLESPLLIVDHLSTNWLLRNPRDREPHAFCGNYKDLDFKELQECVDHFVSSLSIVGNELHLPENWKARNYTTGVLVNGTMHSLSYVERLGKCYDSGISRQAKRICKDALHELFAGQIAYECTDVKEDGQRLRCARSRAEYHNVMRIIDNQDYVPPDWENITRQLELDKQREAQVEEERRQTTEFVTGLKPTLEDQLRDAQQVTQFSKETLAKMEGELNATVGDGSMNVTRLLGPALTFPTLDYDKMLQNKIEEAKAGPLEGAVPEGEEAVPSADPGQEEGGEAEAEEEGDGESEEGGGEGGDSPEAARDGGEAAGNLEQAESRENVDDFIARLRQSVAMAQGGAAEAQRESLGHVAAARDAATRAETPDHAQDRSAHPPPASARRTGESLDDFISRLQRESRHLGPRGEGEGGRGEQLSREARALWERQRLL